MDRKISNMETRLNKGKHVFLKSCIIFQTIRKKLYLFAFTISFFDAPEPLTLEEKDAFLNIKGIAIPIQKIL